MVVFHLLRRNNIRCIWVGKEEIHVLLSVEIDARLHRAHDVGVGDIRDGIIVELATHRMVHIGRIHAGQRIGYTGPLIQLPSTDMGRYFLVRCQYGRGTA